MKIDLALLQEMHPRLPADLAASLTERAGFALGRSRHESPVGLYVELEGVVIDGSLSWMPVEMEEIIHLDHNRITEDGAEAVALVLAHVHAGWRVVRRMQREEHADWLLERWSEGGRKLAALEASGVQQGSLSRRLAEKLAQVSRSLEVEERWAVVVGFGGPRVALRSCEETSDGH